MTPEALPPFSDEDLVLRAQAGDEKALTLLIRRYRPFVSSAASGYFGYALEPDDITQEGLLALLGAVYAFLPDKNAAFRTYAAVCIHNRLRTVVRRAASPKNAPLNAYVPLDELDLAGDGDPVSKVLSDEAAAEIVRIFREDLSALERSVLGRYLNGDSYKETAQALRLTEKAVGNALQRARAKLKKAIGSGS